jgi:hypothetical protein
MKKPCEYFDEIDPCGSRHPSSKFLSRNGKKRSRSPPVLVFVAKGRNSRRKKSHAVRRRGEHLLLDDEDHFGLIGAKKREIQREEGRCEREIHGGKRQEEDRQRLLPRQGREALSNLSLALLDKTEVWRRRRRMACAMVDP